MSLIASGSLIRITKPDGSDMFNSSDKLLHKKFSATGSQTMGNSSVYMASVALGTTMGAQDVAIVTITPTAATGNVASQTLNSAIQLTFPMLCNFTFSTTSAVSTAYDQLSAAVTYGSSPSVVFRYVDTVWDGTSLAAWDTIKAPATSISFNWRVVVLTYQ